MNNKLGTYAGFFAEASKEKWEEAAAAGLTEVELGIDGKTPLHSALAEAESHFDFLTDAGMNVSSVHLPFGKHIDPSSLDDSERDSLMTRLKGQVDWASSKQIPIAVLHASFEPIPDDERSLRLARATEFVSEFGPYCASVGVTLAVENLPRTCLGNTAADLLTITQNGEAAKICFDTNHLLIETHKDFFEQVAPHIVTTHLSDYDRRDERHWLVGDGVIDWTELSALFEASAYEGRFIFEFDENASPVLGRPFSAAELVERFKQVSQ